MRVLVMAPHPFFQHRGTPIAVRLLCETLGKSGHEVDLLTFHEGADVDMAGVKIHRIPFMPRVQGIRPGFSLKKLAADYHLWRKAAAMLKAERYDLIHAVEEAALMARRLSKRFGTPYVYDMDSSLAAQMTERFGVLKPLGPIMRTIEGRAVKDSVGVVAVCQALEDIARAHCAQTPRLRLEDISLLGVDSLRDDRPMEPIEVEGPVVMYVGNLEPYQGIDLLLKSFALVAPDVPDAKLVVVGGPNKVDEYQAKARDMGLGDQAHFVGPRPPGQLSQVLALATVVVSPRTKGGNTPMKIYSYLDSGRPLLATSLYTHTQVLDDDIALLVEPNAEAMAQGLRRLLQDQELAARLAAQAKERVAACYSLQAFEDKLLGFYADLENQISSSNPRDQS